MADLCETELFWEHGCVEKIYRRPSDVRYVAGWSLDGSGGMVIGYAYKEQGSDHREIEETFEIPKGMVAELYEALKTQKEKGMF